MQAILPAEMKTLIRARLRPGISLERENLKGLIFETGRYSYANEQTFDRVLDELVKAGEVAAPGGHFGPFAIVAGHGPKPGGSRRKVVHA